MESVHDIVIVGGGITGLATSLGLHRYTYTYIHASPTYLAFPWIFCVSLVIRHDTFFGKIVCLMQNKVVVSTL